MKKNLTAVALAALKPKVVAYYVGDAKQDGLRVRVSVSGAMTWNLAYRIKGAGLKSVSLGRADPDGRHGLDIASARDRAAQILKSARLGRDLLADEAEDRRLQKDALTLGGLIERYGRDIKRADRKGGALRTADDIERRLLRGLASKLDAPAAGILRSELSCLLDGVAEAYPREAEKRRQGIHAMFKWAVAKGFVPLNPVTGMPSYGHGARRERSLSPAEIRAFWNWLSAGAAAMPPNAIAVLKLQLLLGARAGEIAGMESGEFEERDGELVWTLPASRSKNKRSRVTPLVGLARTVAEAALASTVAGALFCTIDGARALTSADIGHALSNRRDKLPVQVFTSHDIRRSVVSGMDELGIPLDTIAAVVGHQRGTRATETLVRHYSRPNLDRRVSNGTQSGPPIGAQ